MSGIVLYKLSLKVLRCQAVTFMLWSEERRHVHVIYKFCTGKVKLKVHSKLKPMVRSTSVNPNIFILMHRVGNQLVCEATYCPSKW